MGKKAKESKPRKCRVCGKFITSTAAEIKAHAERCAEVVGEGESAAGGAG